MVQEEQLHPAVPEIQPGLPKTRLVSLDDTTFQITVVVGGSKISRSLYKDLEITPDADDIDTWLSQQPGKIAFWRVWAGRAKNIVDVAERKYKKELGSARLRIREQDHAAVKEELKVWAALPAKEQKALPKPSTMTVDDLTAAAENDAKVEAAWQNLASAREVFIVLDAAFKAVDALKSTLISLAANMRSETSSYRNKVRSNDDMQGKYLAERNRQIEAMREQVATVQLPDDPPPQPQVPPRADSEEDGGDDDRVKDDPFPKPEPEEDEPEKAPENIDGPCPELVQALMAEKVNGGTAMQTETAPDTQNGAETDA